MQNISSKYITYNVQVGLSVLLQLTECLLLILQRIYSSGGLSAKNCKNSQTKIYVTSALESSTEVLSEAKCLRIVNWYFIQALLFSTRGGLKRLASNQNQFQYFNITQALSLLQNQNIRFPFYIDNIQAISEGRADQHSIKWTRRGNHGHWQVQSKKFDETLLMQSFLKSHNFYSYHI